MFEILHELHIETTPEKTFRALTEESGLAGWWTLDAHADPVAGTAARFGFSKRTVVFTMMIDKLEKDRLVQWHCLDGPPEWADTWLSFTLEPHGQGTKLRFRHWGWKSTDGIFARCSFDWARYLISLKEYLCSGRGTPHLG
jgi:uncharacterized protein YndB with AHSA1/START domain